MTTNVTEAVGQYFFAVLEKLGLMSPEQAMLSAQAETGVSDEQLESADMGQVFDYMCGYPGIDANLQGFLVNQAEQYNNYGNVSQGGSSYSGGGGGGYSGGGGGGGAAASNQQIVQQVTQNYNYQEINDNSIDILGPVNGNIDIDQDNDDVTIDGDGNAVNTGEGDQNAATGDEASAAQSNGSGDATSNSGDGAIVAGEDIDINAPVNTGVFTGNQTDSGNIENSPVGDGNTVIDLGDAHIEDSALGFGSGDTGNVTDNYLEEGAAASGTGDADGQSVDTNVQSNVTEEHGPGNQVDDIDLDLGRPVVLADEPVLRAVEEPQHHEEPPSFEDNLSDNFSPQVNVNVEGGDGDQEVHQEDLADA